MGDKQMRRFTPILLGTLALQSCASVTTGTTQSLTVVTEPAGAQCKLLRGESASVVGVVSQTPTTMRIDKSGEIMTIECTKEGHEVTRTYLEPDFQAMTLGNAIIGGGIGLMVDAASGAMAKYPENATVVMTPSAFTSAEARDAHYATKKAETIKLWESWNAKASNKCEEDKVRSLKGGAAGAVEDCLAQTQRFEAKKTAALQELETNRLRAKIDS
jgi:hypothetical protein